MIRTATLSFWLIVVVLFKIGSKYSFVLGISFIGLSIVFSIIEGMGFALRMTTYSFGFFLIGTVNYLAEIIKDEKME